MPRPKDTPNTAQMLRVARLFYKDEKTRQEIAELEKIDSRKVSWLLQQARELELVRITFHETTESDLEHRITRRYPHVERALIVPGPKIQTREEYMQLLPRFGSLAADYFDELVNHQPRGKPLHVGVGGGQQLLQFVQSVPQAKREDVFIHANDLIGEGSFPRIANPLHSVVTCSILWSRCGTLESHCQYATVPPYSTRRPGPAARKTATAEMETAAANKNIRDVVEGMDDLDMVFAGIGVINPANAEGDFKHRLSITELLQNVITPEDLANEGAVGDFGCCPFDAEGNRDDRWRFFLTPGHYSKQYWGIEFFKRMVATPGKKVVAFGGPYHLPAIKIMLAAQICNVLITDEATAQEVLEAS